MRKLNKYLCFLVLGILLSSFTFSTNSTLANADLDLVSVFDSPTLAFKIQKSMSEEVVTTVYHTDRNDFQLSTLKNIKFIQVFDQKGNLEYQLPVETTELHLNVNDFQVGVTRVAMMFDNGGSLTYATLEKK